MSWDNHAANMSLERLLAEREAAAVGLDDLAEWFPDGPPSPPSEDPVVRFWEWIEKDPRPAERGVAHRAYPSLLEHLGSFWVRRDEPNIALFHYSDLQADLDGEMRPARDACSGSTSPTTRGRIWSRPRPSTG